MGRYFVRPTQNNYVIFQGMEILETLVRGPAMSSFKVRYYEQGSAEPHHTWAFIDGSKIRLGNGKSQRTMNPGALVLDVDGPIRKVVRLKDETSGLVLVCENPQLLDAIVKIIPRKEISAQLEEAKKKMAATAARIFFQRIAVVAAIVLLSVLAVKSVDMVTALAVNHINPQWESYMAQQYLKDKSQHFDSTSKQAKRVNKIGQRLQAKLGKTPYHFSFVISPRQDVNAYAVPGGAVVIFKGLLNQVKSDDELAGVIGHEIAHIVHRDSLKQIVHNAGIGIGLEIITAGRAQQFQVLLGSAKSMEQLKYSRDEETAADLTGVELAMQAGYSPDAITALFDRVFSGTENRWLAFASDHPMTEERITAIRKKISEMKHSKAKISASTVGHTTR